MPTCQICKRGFNALKFETEHIGICTRCVNTLNDAPEPAKNAELRLGELLARGMLRNANIGFPATEETALTRARKEIVDFDLRYSRALPGWINKLLANPSNGIRDFKIMRAHRRGLLRMDSERQWSYPSDWKDRASRIRKRDRICRLCEASNGPLDVHHIVYLSNYGTNQQSNLIALCRPCHENVHERTFDLGESGELSNRNASVDVPSRSKAVDSTCPKCRAQLIVKISPDQLQTQKIRCPACERVFVVTDQPATVPSVPSSLPLSVPLPPLVRQAERNHPQPQWVTPHSANARGIGWLRFCRGIVGALLGFQMIAWLGAIYQAGGFAEFFAASTSFNLVLRAGWALSLWYAFRELRRRINERHRRRYGYPHPAMKHPWGL